MGMKPKKCDVCGCTDFVYHKEKRWYKFDHWHCKKCRKQYDKIEKSESEHYTEADYQTWYR